MSRRYSSDDPHPTETAPEGGDQTVPEFRNRFAPHDPFAVDIYCVGNAIREYILDVGPWFFDAYCVATHYLNM